LKEALRIVDHEF